jgi:hypothetical protein
MKLIALMLARNEEWVIGQSLPAILRWCDGVVVLDHASTDRTATIAESFANVRLLRETDPVWYEMRYRQRTLDAARDMGASHMAIIDADEMLTENLVPTIRGEIEKLTTREVLQVPWVCCWRSTRRQRKDNSVWSRARVPMAFCDTLDLHWATRELGGAKGYDFHQRPPINARNKVGDLEGGVLHLQHANWDRLRAKQVLYRMTELLRWPEFGVDAINRRYGPTSNEDGMRLADIPPHWLPPELASVDVNAASWQLGEIHRLIFQHGRERFEGLDFLGLEV